MSSAQTINSLEQSVELVERFAQCLIKDSKSPDDLALAQQLAPYVAYFNTEIEMTKIREQIYERFLNMVNSSSEKLDCDSIIEQFNEEIDSAKKRSKSSQRSKRYNDFMKMISKQNSGDDDGDDDGDIRTISETVNTIDPISKLPIVEPVKNKKCGHTYEKNSILQLLEKNPRTKCPIAGCSATNFVRKGDLVPDNALKRMLSNTNCDSQKKLKLDE